MTGASRRERILLLVGSFKGMTGLGGHYFSVLEIARSLSSTYDVLIVNIGEFPAKALMRSEFRIPFVRLRPSLFRVDRSALVDEVRAFKPNVVIAADAISGQVCRPICVKTRTSFIQLKAGGPIPLTYFPKDVHQIHFGMEDLEWAKRRLKGRARVVEWIPNRVLKRPRDLAAVAQIREEQSIAEKDIVLVRIGRITDEYRPAFEAAVCLTRYLRANGFPARLLIIGIRQDPQLCSWLEGQLSDQDAILSTEKYTVEASRLLPIGQINVGVGRGFMEGCSESQYMFFPAAGGGLPLLVDQENIRDLFAKNFSMRARMHQESAKREADALAVANSIASGCLKSDVSYRWFEEYFSAADVARLYQPIIAAAMASPERWSADLVRSEIALRGQGIRRLALRAVPVPLQNRLRRVIRRMRKLR